MRSTPKKTCAQIITSDNHYLGALKGNHGNFFKALKAQFHPESHIHTVESGHGRTERRTVELWQTLDTLSAADEWAGLTSVIRVISYRHLHKGQSLMIKKPQVRYL